MPELHRARQNYYSRIIMIVIRVYGIQSPAYMVSGIQGLGASYLRHSMVVFPVGTKGSRNFQIWYSIRGFVGPREPESFSTLYAFLKWMFSVHCNVPLCFYTCFCLMSYSRARFC